MVSSAAGDPVTLAPCHRDCDPARAIPRPVCADRGVACRGSQRHLLPILGEGGEAVLSGPLATGHSLPWGVCGVGAAHPRL